MYDFFFLILDTLKSWSNITIVETQIILVFFFSMNILKFIVPKADPSFDYPFKFSPIDCVWPSHILFGSNDDSNNSLPNLTQNLPSITLCWTSHHTGQYMKTLHTSLNLQRCIYDCRINSFCLMVTIIYCQSTAKNHFLLSWRF